DRACKRLDLVLAFGNRLGKVAESDKDRILMPLETCGVGVSHELPLDGVPRDSKLLQDHVNVKRRELAAFDNGPSLRSHIDFDVRALAADCIRDETHFVLAAPLSDRR